MPLCRSTGQTGCVVTYNSYGTDPPPDATAFFGRGPRRASSAPASTRPPWVAARRCSSPTSARPRPVRSASHGHHPPGVAARCHLGRVPQPGRDDLPRHHRRPRNRATPATSTKAVTNDPGWGLHTSDVDLAHGQPDRDGAGPAEPRSLNHAPSATSTGSGDDLTPVRGRSIAERGPRPAGRCGSTARTTTGPARTAGSGPSSSARTTPPPTTVTVRPMRASTWASLCVQRVARPVARDVGDHGRDGARPAASRHRAAAASGRGGWPGRAGPSRRSPSGTARPGPGLHSSVSLSRSTSGSTHPRARCRLSHPGRSRAAPPGSRRASRNG